MKTTFEAWMVKVNKLVSDRVGLTTDDLPDCPYADWHQDGMTPKGAASKAIRMADGGDE